MSTFPYFKGKASRQENGGWYVTFADGSEKWIQPDKVYKLVSLLSKDNQGMRRRMKIAFQSLDLQAEKALYFRKYQI